MAGQATGAALPASAARVLAALLLVASCTTGGTSSSSEESGLAVAQGTPPPSLEPGLRVDLLTANRLWPQGSPATSVDDLFRLRVESSFGEWTVDTHLFDEGMVVIPYHDQDGVSDAAGRFVERGDAELANAFPLGEIGIAVRHHRPKHRSLRIGASDVRYLEEMQLRDSHVEILVGVERRGQPGVVTLNSPQGYESGRFGGADYPMLFLALSYPEELSERERREYRDNIRTFLLAFNEVLRFPFGYLEGDHLAARDPSAVRDHAVMVVRAISGDERARQWFAEPSHRLYCSELAFLSLSAGLLLPLNASTFEPLVGPEAWQRFAEQIERHQRGEPSELTRLNRNPLARLVPTTLAPAGLEPFSSRRSRGNSPEKSRELALRPMTVPDIFEQFVTWIAPREHPPEGLDREAMAAAQAELLVALEPEVMRLMGLDRRPLDDPERLEGEAIYREILAVVQKSHPEHRTLREELEPVLAWAREFCMECGRPKRDLLVPPLLFHLSAAGRWPGGSIGLRYVGHGFHWSLVSRGE